MYSAQERREFLARFENESEDLRLKALAMYARPVINKHALNLQAT